MQVKTCFVPNSTIYLKLQYFVSRLNTTSDYFVFTVLAWADPSPFMLSLKHNFVFIHIPKTGGNSIQSVIEPFTEDLLCDRSPDHDLVNRFAVLGPITNRKHCTSAEYIEKLGLKKF